MLMAGDRQPRVGPIGVIKDMYILTGGHSVAVDSELIAQVIRQWPAEDVHPSNPAASLTKVTNTRQPGVIVWNI